MDFTHYVDYLEHPGILSQRYGALKYQSDVYGPVFNSVRDYENRIANKNETGSYNKHER